MDTIDRARQVIVDAESKLRDLIGKALAEQRYSDVKEIAGLADGIAQLLQSSEIQLSVTTRDRTSESSTEGALRDVLENALEVRRPKTSGYSAKRAKAATRRASGPKKGYPKFVRDEDRLIKIGWSKKNKDEYEHRVPREAVLAFVRYLDEKVAENKVFDIDSLFPVPDGSGGEVPGYQVYVIVAWLRELNVIEKKGRDGYVIRNKSVLRGELDDQWNCLQPKSA